MFVFKQIDKSSTTFTTNVVNCTQNLTTSSAGVQSHKIVSGSISQSYWSSLNVLFYTSGSPVYGFNSSTASLGEFKFTAPSSNFSLQYTDGKQFLSKFHGYPSSSIIQIPQQYYGERIKPGSFTFTDINNSDSSNNNPIIVDDGLGNLYSTNANLNSGIQAAGVLTARSSSENYVGNIFYDKGLAIITETGSWSGSGAEAVNYSDLATNYELRFDSHDTIRTSEYNITLAPQEYNSTTNYSVRSPLSGSNFSLSTPFLASTFTGSEFQPYITQINLWKDGIYDEPIIQATLPRPIRKSDKINLRFKIKLDM